jgi:hypothetical protein
MGTLLLLIGTIIILPIMVLVDSKKRLRILSWEWALFGFVITWFWAGMAIDLVLPLMGHGLALLRGPVAILPACLVWAIYRKTEVPVAHIKSRLKTVRAGSVVLMAVVFAAFGSGQLSGPVDQMLLLVILASLVAFISSHVFIFRTCRTRNDTSVGRGQSSE